MPKLELMLGVAKVPSPDFIKEVEMESLQRIVVIVLCLLACKTIFGFHFPWERCDCCGKKYKDHKRGQDVNK